jgi:hypothetical protein
MTSGFLEELDSTETLVLILTWLVVWNMAFIFPKSWDDDPI